MILMGASTASHLYSTGLNWQTTDWRDGRVAEGGGLLNRYTVKSCIEGSNPSLSASRKSLNNVGTETEINALSISGCVPALRRMNYGTDPEFSVGLFQFDKYGFEFGFSPLIHSRKP